MLLSSSDDDPERLAADSHARECGLCEAERAGAAAFLAVLSELPAAPPPSEWALGRAKAAVLAELAAQARPRARPAFPWELGAAAAVFMAIVAMARHPTFEGRPLAGSLLLVAWGVAVLFGGRLYSAVAASVIGAVLLSSGGSLELGHALSCGVSELGGALLPIGALFAVVRLKGLTAKPADFAAAALGGALAGQAALALTCPSHSLGHLLVLHAAVVALAGLMGAGIGRLATAR